MATLLQPKATPPSKVAALRGLLYAVLAVIVGALVALTPADAAQLGPAAPFLIAGARYLEGRLFDRNQPPQARALGGRPA